MGDSLLSSFVSSAVNACYEHAHPLIKWKHIYYLISSPIFRYLFININNNNLAWLNKCLTYYVGRENLLSKKDHSNRCIVIAWCMQNMWAWFKVDELCDKIKTRLQFWWCFGRISVSHPVWIGLCRGECPGELTNLILGYWGGVVWMLRILVIGNFYGWIRARQFLAWLHFISSIRREINQEVSAWYFYAIFGVVLRTRKKSMFMSYVVETLFFPIYSIHVLLNLGWLGVDAWLV